MKADRAPARHDDPAPAARPAWSPRRDGEASGPGSGGTLPLLTAGNAAVARLVQRYAAGTGGTGEDLAARVQAVPETIMASGYTFTIRNLVQQVADEVMQAPAQTIGRLIGRPPG